MHIFVQRLRETLEHARAGRLNGWDATSNRCVYRTPEGTGCGIGVFLNDDEIAGIETADLNSAAYSSVLDRFPQIGQRLDLSSGEGALLQALHDSVFSRHGTPKEKIATYIANGDRLLAGKTLNLISDSYFDHSVCHTTRRIDENQNRVVTIQIKPEVLAA